LQHEYASSSDCSNNPNGASTLFLPTKFHHTIVKELTTSDVVFGYLVGFVEDVFQKLSWFGFLSDFIAC
jgi:hypothetical protein